MNHLISFNEARVNWVEKDTEITKWLRKCAEKEVDTDQIKEILYDLTDNLGFCQVDYRSSLRVFGKKYEVIKLDLDFCRWSAQYPVHNENQSRDAYNECSRLNSIINYIKNDSSAMVFFDYSINFYLSKVKGSPNPKMFNDRIRSAGDDIKTMKDRLKDDGYTYRASRFSSSRMGTYEIDVTKELDKSLFAEYDSVFLSKL